MGQYWCLKNIDRREDFNEGKLGEWLVESDHHDLLSELAIPVQLPKEYDTWLNTGKRVTQRAPLFKLPDEMLGMIFAELDFEDASLVCFAITCKELLVLARRPILKAMNRTLPTWANCRLICLGDNTQDIEELPAGMLTTEELATIGNTLSAESADDADAADEPELEAEYPSVADLLMLAGEPAKLKVTSGYYMGDHRFISRSLLQDVFRSMGQRIVAPLRKRGWVARSRTRKLHWRVVEQDRLQAFVFKPIRPTPEVLCNLSKGEYVRHAALPDVPDFEDVSLAHALIVQVLWSTCPSCNTDIPEEYEGRVSRGHWAGDRFCVTTMETMPELAPGIGEWRDVSDDVAKYLRHFLHY
ncbi:hypothetical protein GY45DRAFT_966137 [Cubamyces sp. BRFM 1775]|nr:hypothetical protein GY45DRAFT_966137 [Cubamyces sp. BRFM 1775]